MDATAWLQGLMFAHLAKAVAEAASFAAIASGGFGVTAGSSSLQAPATSACLRVTGTFLKDMEPVLSHGGWDLARSASGDYALWGIK